MATEPPLFRSFAPAEEPVRYFPQLRPLLDGRDPVRGENLPVDSRELRFRLTARDNAAGGGGVADVEITVTTDANAGPFVVTSQNTAEGAYTAGTDLDVTWNVAGTDGGAVNTPTVDILYSEDDGETFLTLLESTANDGAATITLPLAETAVGRIMVRGSDNIFFDVNDAPFTVAFGVASESEPEGSSQALSAVYPNPVGRSGVASAAFSLTARQTETVRVAVYDALGREVGVLYEGIVVAGEQRPFALDAADLAGGIYFVRAVGETFVEVRPFTVVR